jgi:hypothetical protein
MEFRALGRIMARNRKNPKIEIFGFFHHHHHEIFDPESIITPYIENLAGLGSRPQAQMAIGSIFANPLKVGTMGSPNPAKFFLVIFYVIGSNFFFGRKSLK